MKRRHIISDLTQVRVFDRGEGFAPVMLGLGERSTTLSGLARAITELLDSTSSTRASKSKTSVSAEETASALSELRSMLLDPTLVDSVCSALYGRPDRNFYREHPVLDAALFTHTALSAINGGSPAVRNAYLGIIYTHLKTVAPATIMGTTELILGMEERPYLIPRYSDLLRSVVRSTLGKALTRNDDSVNALVAAFGASGRPTVRALASVVHAMNQVVAQNLLEIPDLRRKLNVVLGEAFRAFIKEPTPAADAASNDRFKGMLHDFTLVMAALEKPEELMFLTRADGFYFAQAVDHIGAAFASAYSETKLVSVAELRGFYRYEKVFDPALAMPAWVSCSRSIDLARAFAGATQFVVRSPLSTGSAFECYTLDGVARDAFRDMPALWAAMMGRETQEKMIDVGLARLTTPLLAWTSTLADREAWCAAMALADALEITISDALTEYRDAGLQDGVGSTLSSLVGLDDVARSVELSFVGTLDQRWLQRVALPFAARLDDGQFTVRDPLLCVALVRVPADTDKMTYPVATNAVAEKLEEATRAGTVLAIPGAIPTSRAWLSRTKRTVTTSFGNRTFRSELDARAVMGESLLLTNELELILSPYAMGVADEALNLIVVATSVAAADQYSRLEAGAAWLNSQVELTRNQKVLSGAAHLRQTLTEVVGPDLRPVNFIDTRRAQDRQLVVALRLTAIREFTAVVLGSRVNTLRAIERDIELDRTVAMMSHLLLKQV